MKVAELTSLVAPVVAALGLEVDRAEIRPAGRRSLVQIYLDGDGPDGLGPSLDEIAAATRAISAAMDASSLPGDAPYTLEVSSRGVGRPLTDAKHFRRNRGRLVTVTLPGGPATGRIVAAGDDALVLDVDGDVRHIDWADVGKAVVQVEFSRPDDEEE